jgi:hypothetical protein
MRCLAILLLCSTAFAQYPPGCSKAVTPSGFDGCELGEIQKLNAAVKANPQRGATETIAQKQRAFFIQSMAILHPGMKYQSAHDIKDKTQRDEFEKTWPDGRLTTK